MMPMQRSEPKNVGAWLTDGASMFGGDMVVTTTDVAMNPPLKAVMTLKVQYVNASNLTDSYWAG
jgi:hypothetical protein